MVTGTSRCRRHDVCQQGDVEVLTSVGVSELINLSTLVTPAPSWTPGLWPHKASIAMKGTAFASSPLDCSQVNRVSGNTKTGATRALEMKIHQCGER